MTRAAEQRVLADRQTALVAWVFRERELADRLLEGADAPARLGTEELLELLRG